MEVSDQIIKVLDNLGEKFGIAIDWTSENVLPYIQQLGHKIIMYDLFISIVWLVIALVSISIGVIIGKKVYIIYKDGADKRESNIMINYTRYEYTSDSKCLSELGFILTILVILMVLFGTIALFPNLQHIIQDIVFPEKTIIEFITLYIK